MEKNERKKERKRKLKRTKVEEDERNKVLL